MDITIIIPAFNESKRLPKFLSQTISYCKRSRMKYEIIVVDDGSTDATYEKALQFKSQFPDLSILKLKKNKGKGYAVRRGFFAAKGGIILFMDADGSTSPDEIEKNLSYFDKGYDVVIGSRVLRGQEQALETCLHRRIIGGVFNFFTRAILFRDIDIKDTQCGLKMFRKKVVKMVFNKLRIRRFGFDVELLNLIHNMGYKIKEVPVSWRHVKGGKVNLIRDPFLMLISVFRVKGQHSRMNKE